MERIRRELTRDLLKEPRHEIVFNAMSNAENSLIEEMHKTGGNKELVKLAVKATREYDKFVFTVYLNKLIRCLNE